MSNKHDIQQHKNLSANTNLDISEWIIGVQNSVNICSREKATIPNNYDVKSSPRTLRLRPKTASFDTVVVDYLSTRTYCPWERRKKKRPDKHIIKQKDERTEYLEECLQYSKTAIFYISKRNVFAFHKIHRTKPYCRVIDKQD